MSAHPIPRLSPERYLEIERGNDFRSEYYEGQMYAMSGGSLQDSMLIAGVAACLRNALAKGPCRVTASELLVRASKSGPYMYPEVAVFCDEPKLADDHRDVLLNPTLIVEVLSKSTESHDRGQKFTYYRQIESLREYILVSQSQPRVETFSRQESGEWVLKEYVGLDASCLCRSIDCTIPLAGIYDKVPFESE